MTEIGTHLGSKRGLAHPACNASKKRRARNSLKALKLRIEAYTKMPVDRRKGYHKPGSENQHKSISLQTTRRQHRGGR